MSERGKALLVVLAFGVMGLLTWGTLTVRSANLAVRASNLAGCRRDVILRAHLRAGALRAYRLRVVEAEGKPVALALAVSARDDSLDAYASHGC